MARNHGIQFTIVTDIGINEGIDAVRNLLNRCWFDEKWSICDHLYSKGAHRMSSPGTGYVGTLSTLP